LPALNHWDIERFCLKGTLIQQDKNSDHQLIESTQQKHVPLWKKEISNPVRPCSAKKRLEINQLMPHSLPNAVFNPSALGPKQKHLALGRRYIGREK
jgi:hypothetical protein